MTLGQMLKSARTRLGRTLRELEGSTGISNGYLSQLESDRIKQPSPRHLFKLADTLGLEYHSLMLVAGYVTPTDNIGQRTIGGELPGLEQLTEEERAKVTAYIQDLRDARQGRRQAG